MGDSELVDQDFLYIRKRLLVAGFAFYTGVQRQNRLLRAEAPGMDMMYILNSRDRFF